MLMLSSYCGEEESIRGGAIATQVYPWALLNKHPAFHGVGHPYFDLVPCNDRFSSLIGDTVFVSPQCIEPRTRALTAVKTRSNNEANPCGVLH